MNRAEKLFLLWMLFGMMLTIIRSTPGKIYMEGMVIFLVNACLFFFAGDDDNDKKLKEKQ